MNNKIRMMRKKRKMRNNKKAGGDIMMKKYIDFLKNEYTGHQVLNISYKLTNENYTQYQIANTTKRVVLLAHRANECDETFIKNYSPDCNVIVMYNGSFVCFKKEDFDKDDKIKNKLKKLRDNRSNDRNCCLCDRSYDDKLSPSCSNCDSFFCSECVCDLYDKQNENIKDTIISEKDDDELYLKCLQCGDKKGISLSL